MERSLRQVPVAFRQPTPQFVRWRIEHAQHDLGPQSLSLGPVVIAFLPGPHPPVEHHVAARLKDTYGDTPLHPLNRITHGIELVTGEARMKLMQSLVSRQPKGRPFTLQTPGQRRLAGAGHPTGEKDNRHGRNPSQRGCRQRTRFDSLIVTTRPSPARRKCRSRGVDGDERGVQARRSSSLRSGAPGAGGCKERSASRVFPARDRAAGPARPFARCRPSIHARPRSLLAGVRRRWC